MPLDEDGDLPTVDQAIADWLRGTDISMIDVCMDAPETAWEAINRLLAHELSEDQIAVLAAGPMEELLTYHGAAYIARVEQEAARNPRFNYLLGGVWQNRMPVDIWERVKRVQKEVW